MTRLATTGPDSQPEPAAPSLIVHNYDPLLVLLTGTAIVLASVPE
jgi:hypothetical protein